MDYIDIPGRAARYLASRFSTAPLRPGRYAVFGVALDGRTVAIDAMWDTPGGMVELHEDVPLPDLLADAYSTASERRRRVWEHSLMSDLSRERAMNGGLLPTVTPEMLAQAVRVVLGAAHDARDALVLCEALGFTRQDLSDARGTI